MKVICRVRIKYLKGEFELWNSKKVRFDDL